MKKTKLAGLDHITAVEIKNKELQQVKVSPFAKSETRFVAPITIDMKDLGDKTGGSVLLVDSPGCGDTRSEEVDLSNSFGLLKAIEKSKSIVPVIIISYVHLHGTAEIFKNSIQYYQKMVKNVKQRIKYFNYFFSHVP